ncbi:MAG: AraC family transcriptional regulator [Pseudomonadota bacterium]
MKANQNATVPQPESAGPSTEGAAARRISAGTATALLLPRQAYEARYTPDRDCIGFAFDPQSGEHSFASDRTESFVTRPNSLAFVPAGCDVYSRSAHGGEYLFLDMGRPARSAARCFNDAIMPDTVAAAHALRRLLLASEPVDPLVFGDLVTRLEDGVTMHLETTNRAGNAGHWMTPARRRKVDTLIEDSLDRRIGISDLAQPLGLSDGFFTRAFKAAYGKAPYDHVIDRRIARARQLISQGEQDLSAIAFACGFASHAQMTDLFRRRLGVPPSHLR